MLLTPETGSCQFTTGDQQYFKTPEMKNMDEHFGDIHTKIIGTLLSSLEHADEEIRRRNMRTRWPKL